MVTLSVFFNALTAAVNELNDAEANCYAFASDGTRTFSLLTAGNDGTGTLCQSIEATGSPVQISANDYLTQTLYGGIQGWGGFGTDIYFKDGDTPYDLVVSEETPMCEVVGGEIRINIVAQ